MDSSAFTAVSVGRGILASKKEIEQIRDLAYQIAEIAHSERMHKRRRMWARHNNLEKVERPPVMCRPIGAWAELVPADSIVSVDPLHREIEYILRRRLYKDCIDDDEVIEPWVDIQAIHLGPDRSMMWGVNINTVTPGDAGGAFGFKPEIKEELDIERLRVPDWQVDEDATRERYERASELLDGILDVRLIYGRLTGASLAYWGAYLRGLEQMMYDCMDRPEWFHRFMKFLSDAHLQHLKGLEADGHIVRNDNARCNSVCLACDGLPQPNVDGERIRLKETWCVADSQEFTLISPEQWDEFLLAYQLPIFKLHGLVSYGCCESLVGKLGILKAKVPNLRRITISPWSNINYSAEQCQKNIVIQIRPMPSEVLMHFSEDDMRKDLVQKMEAAGDTIFDFCLQDIETVSGRPEILNTWTRIAKEVGRELYHR